MFPASDGDVVIAGAAVQSEESCSLFSLAEIQRATNNFNDALVIGVGGFGKVYKGFMNDGATVVAIKRLNSESKQGEGEFWTEINMLSKFRHTHLVALIGYCNESDEMILVYEYMAYGTLAHHLYESSRNEGGNGMGIISHLCWEKRLEICLGVARGLNYLHNGTDQFFIHRDVKTTNILLDDKWVAKISDFGLSKGGTNQSITHFITDVKGTFGYLDPDYFSTHRLTKKSDVYAFGVVLFEVLCGRPALEKGLEEDQINLVLWAQQCIKKGKLGVIIHPSLIGQISPCCLKYFVQIANSCLRRHSKERPTMAEVVQSLEQVLASQRKGCIVTKVLRVIGLVPKGGSTSEPISNSSEITPPVLRPFSDTEIRAATNDFDGNNLIGYCLGNNIYKGCIDGGILVAIKRLRGLTKQELSKVKAAIEVLKARVCQPHMVSLIGFCFTEHEAYLVYEYMANGSLEGHLYGEYNEQLPWRIRLQICIDVARVLQSLCAKTTGGVLHINIKPYHILLDEKWTAKIADFALSKLFPADIVRYIAFNFTYFNLLPSDDNDDDGGICHSPTSPLHPELIDFMYSETQKTYMYSFGVLLLEVLCANKPLEFSSWWNRDNDLASLVRRCERSVKSGTSYEVIDEYVFRTIAPECLREFVKIVSSCVLDENQQPSSMDHVLARLQYALQLQEAWENREEISAQLVTLGELDTLRCSKL